VLPNSAPSKEITAPPPGSVTPANGLLGRQVGTIEQIVVKAGHKAIGHWSNSYRRIAPGASAAKLQTGT
jgi:hypothetical protein